jgi:hypothetical protein
MLDIRAIEVTTNAIGDAPMLSDLLAQIPQDEQILSVGGDGAYDTRACHAALLNVVPMRSSRSVATANHGRKTVPASMLAMKRCATKRHGRAIWKKWSGYHRRSLVEAKMHCFNS